MSYGRRRIDIREMDQPPAPSLKPPQHILELSLDPTRFFFQGSPDIQIKALQNDWLRHFSHLKPFELPIEVQTTQAKLADPISASSTAGGHLAFCESKYESSSLFPPDTGNFISREFQHQVHHDSELEQNGKSTATQAKPMPTLRQDFKVRLNFHFDFPSLRSALKRELQKEIFSFVDTTTTTFCVEDKTEKNDWQEFAVEIDVHWANIESRYVICMQNIFQGHAGKLNPFIVIFKSTSKVDRASVLRESRLDLLQAQRCYIASYVPNGDQSDIFDNQGIRELAKDLCSEQLSSCTQMEI